MPTEIRKALTASGDGAVLTNIEIDQVLHEELLNLQPLAQLIPTIPVEGLTHTYKSKTAHPQAWFEGELTPANYANGTYTSKSVSLKIQRIWGSVSGFSQATTEPFINALAEELSGSVQGMGDILEFGILHGAGSDIWTAGDAYQYTGILPRVYKDAPANVINAGGDKITLDDLDSAVAKARKFRQVKTDPYLWMMGQEMKLVVDGLQTRVQMPLRSMELYDGKLVMASYAAMPIYESDVLGGNSDATSPAVSGSAATGGSLSDANYVYAISAVTDAGEQAVGTSAEIDSPASGVVSLTWTHVDAALSYMVWRGSTSTNMKLLDIIPAKTYDAAGTVNGNVESYTDSGTKSTVSQIAPLQANEEIIVLMNRNGSRGASFLGNVDAMGSRIGTLATYVPLARTRDSYDYMLKAYLASRLIYPNLVAVIRNVKRS